MKLRKTLLEKRSAIFVLLIFGVLLGGAWAQTESVLYSFSGSDGAFPLAGLVLDQNGNFYGTTSQGGAAFYGTVFKLTPKGKEGVLYSFCAQNGCVDGAYPQAGVVFDQNGNLYGTTAQGGSSRCNWNGHGCGVVFKLTPKGKQTVLHTFCSQTSGTYCTDGAIPFAGVVFDRKGNLYGTTTSGGAHGGGVVFELPLKGKYTVLYSFCAQTNCTDGIGPYAGLIFDEKGNLYGTTAGGGTSNECGGESCGVVFKLTPEGKETVLHSFSGSDGAFPVAGLVLDQKGNLYGTTSQGGAQDCYPNYGCGVVFKLSPQGVETVLYTFCGQSACTDGANPYARLVLDQKGNLYGTTKWGGAPVDRTCYPYACGVAFKLTSKGQETVLHSFCSQSGCTDGGIPYAGLIFDRSGNLYGTTSFNGANGRGVVFKLLPDDPAYRRRK